jgi:uncharacterized protein
MVRIVRQPDGIVIDPTGKVSGRGAYLHNQRSCWERGIKGGLAGALKTELSEKDRQTLLAYMQTLPTDEPVQEAMDGK